MPHSASSIDADAPLCSPSASCNLAHCAPHGEIHFAADGLTLLCIAADPRMSPVGANAEPWTTAASASEGRSTCSLQGTPSSDSRPSNRNKWAYRYFRKFAAESTIRIADQPPGNKAIQAVLLSGNRRLTGSVRITRQPEIGREAVNLTGNALLVELASGVLPRIGNDMWALLPLGRHGGANRSSLRKRGFTAPIPSLPLLASVGKRFAIVRYRA